MAIVVSITGFAAVRLNMMSALKKMAPSNIFGMKGTRFEYENVDLSAAEASDLHSARSYRQFCLSVVGMTS